MLQYNNLVTHEERFLVQRPIFTSSLRGFNMRYPMFGPVARICKRWMHAHMFTDFIYEEAIELLVAYLFLNPSPYNAPGSLLCGLHRFLELISTFDWDNNPLIVDINGELNVSLYERIMVFQK